MKSISNTEIKVFSVSLQSGGQIIVPPDVQEQLNLTEGVELTLLQIGEILLLTPKVPKVPQIAEQISSMKCLYFPLQLSS